MRRTGLAGGNLVVSHLKDRKYSAYRSTKAWSRRLTGPQTSGARQRCGWLADEPQTLWENFVGHPSKWEKASSEYVGSKAKVREAQAVGLYSASGAVQDGVRVSHFDHYGKCQEWTQFGRDRELGQAFQAVEHMFRQGEFVTRAVLYRILRGCILKGDLVVGRQVHSLSVRCGYASNNFLGNHLIRMYASQGELLEAKEVFRKLPAPDVFVWTAIISGYAEYGQPEQAIKFYQEMRQSTTQPNEYLYVAVVKACIGADDITAGKLVHADVVDSGLESNVFVGSTLVDMYSKLGILKDARAVFDRMSARNIVTWNTMIGAYAQNGLGPEALELNMMLSQDGITPDSLSYVNVLKACGSIGDLYSGKQIHAQFLAQGLHTDAFLGSSLVDMYAKCGSLEDSRVVFDNLPAKNVAAWTAMIVGYAQNGLNEEAIQLYGTMQQYSISPDAGTYVSILKVCGCMGEVEVGKQIHARILEGGLEDVVVGSALVDMYSRCGKLDEARRVLDGSPARDVTTWNSMLVGYCQHGFDSFALDLYSRMCGWDIRANSVTFVNILKACGRRKDLQLCKQIHTQILKSGYDADVFVGSTLVDTYVICGSVDNARQVFDSLSIKNVITWTAMVEGYAQRGQGREALNLFASMQQHGMTPDHLTFVSVLKACASVGAVQTGKQVHAKILEEGMESNAFVASTLVDMYAKCGNLVEAERLFDRFPTKDVVTWTSLINAYGQHNDWESAIQCFKQMKQYGVEPDAATFTCLLVACSHVGRLDEGQQYFRMMEDEGFPPGIEHYTSMVDLLGRSGQLDEAQSLLNSMPFQPSGAIWMSLLSACKSYCDLERGRICFNQLLELEPQHSAVYVLMSSIYANAGRWEDVNTIEQLRIRARAFKKPAAATIEIENRVHEFIVGDQTNDISCKIRSLNGQMKEEGHVPNTAQVLKPLSEEEKEDALCGHAEKLALAFGLLNTAPGSTLLVTKNLRMCDDCHSGTKVVSRIEGREIIVRDAHRVHHFKDGYCSCGDHR